MAYFAVDGDHGLCLLDLERIPPIEADLKKCKAFEEWWGAVD